GHHVAGFCQSGCPDEHCRKAGEQQRDQNPGCWSELNVSIFHNLISFSCFGFVAVVLGDPETQTVSHSFPKLCAALQRKRREPQRSACRSAIQRPDRAGRLQPGTYFGASEATIFSKRG